MLYLRNILVVEDERLQREAVCSYLQKQGCGVLAAETGREALRLFAEREIDFIVLDLMLPDMSGEEVCRELRRQSKVPVIMLTAKSAEEEMLQGLALGADDYVVKPFSLKNLYARIQAIWRRYAGNMQASLFTYDDGVLFVDYERREARQNGAALSLTPIEWKLLTLFTKYPQKIFSRDDLLTAVCAEGCGGYDRVIDTHIKNLRRKLGEDPKNPVYILTVHGFGYKFGGGR